MTDPVIITTKTYRLTPVVYFRIAAGARLPTIIGIIAAISFIALVLGTLLDLRFIFIALILIFLITPVAVGHIYYSKLLTVEARYALALKRLEIYPEHHITEIFESADDANTPPAPRQWQWAEIARKRTDGKNLIVTFTDTDATLIIPFSSVENSNDLIKLSDQP